MSKERRTSTLRKSGPGALRVLTDFRAVISSTCVNVRSRFDWPEKGK